MKEDQRAHLLMKSKETSSINTTTLSKQLNMLPFCQSSSKRRLHNLSPAQKIADSTKQIAGSRQQRQAQQKMQKPWQARHQKYMGDR
jgi:hypothetical protein